MRQPSRICMLRTATVATLLLGIAACAPTTPQWDSRFGETVRLTAQQQTLNPKAGGDAPVNGIDAATGRESIGRYRSSFREPPPAPSPISIGVGR